MAIINPIPYQISNGTTNDATQVMADINQIVTNVNSNSAKNGANNDITSLAGLTTPLSAAQGGTGNIAGTANVAGGAAGGIVYQSGVATSAVSATGTAGQVLVSNGAGAPTWGTPTSFFWNFLHNGRGQVAQRPTTAFGVANTPIYGMCDRWLVGTFGATTHTAGTIDQGTMACLDGITRTCVQATGFTTTGAGTQIVMKHRLEVKDVSNTLNGKQITVQAEVLQATGGAINYQIQVNAATTPDAFGTVTTLGTSGNISAATGVTTQLSYTLTLGNTAANNGLEFVIIANCGAVTTQTFKMTSAQVILNSAVAPYSHTRTYPEELMVCSRYLQLAMGSSAQTLGYVNSAGTAGLFDFAWDNTMRAPITGLLIGGTLFVQDTTGAAHTATTVTVTGSQTSIIISAAAAGLTANQPATLNCAPGGYILALGAEL